MFPPDPHDCISRGDFILRDHRLYATLEIKNPAAKNAISIKMMRQLKEIVASLEAKPPLGLIIYGVEHFCSGGDLVDVRDHLMASSLEMLEYMTDLLNRIQSLSSIVIAAVDGAAVGGGAELTTIADYVICRDTSKIGFVHARLGVSPGWGGAGRLLKKVGSGNAIKILCAAEVLESEDLLKFGLVNEVVDDKSAYDQAVELMKRITSNHEPAVRGLLKIIKNSASEGSVFDELWGSGFHRKVLGLKGD